MSVLTIPFTGIYSLELADYKMKRMSRSDFNLSLLKGVGSVLAVLIFVVLLHWGATGRLFATLFDDVSVFLYLLFKHKDVWKIKTNLKELKTVLMFCWPLALGAALGYFSNGYDKSVLEPIGNIDEYGYYCVGLSIAGYLGIFTSTISATFQPDTYEAIISGNISRIFKIASLRLGLTLLVVAIFLLFCPLVVRILTAGKYLAAVPYARIMSISAVTSSAYYIINDYSIAKGKPYMYLITTILGSIVIIFLMPVFVCNFSYIGGALMNVLSFVIFLVINLMLLVLLSAKSINKV
jgi:O-antigen/teichoic acid export membrane protein